MCYPASSSQVTYFNGFPAIFERTVIFPDFPGDLQTLMIEYCISHQVVDKWAMYTMTLTVTCQQFVTNVFE